MVWPLILQVAVRPGRGMSTAIQGLSRNCPELPESTTVAPMYEIGLPWAALPEPMRMALSPFPLLFMS